MPGIPASGYTGHKKVFNTKDVRENSFAPKWNKLNAKQTPALAYIKQLQ